MYKEEQKTDGGSEETNGRYPSLPFMLQKKNYGLEEMQLGGRSLPGFAKALDWVFQHWGYWGTCARGGGGDGDPEVSKSVACLVTDLIGLIGFICDSRIETASNFQSKIVRGHGAGPETAPCCPSQQPEFFPHTSILLKPGIPPVPQKRISASQSV